MSEDKKAKMVFDTTAPEGATVGDLLQAARVKKGLKLEDVSASIHIRATQLKAIEENDLTPLPGMTYAIGFVRSYANYLGLNSADIVQKFKMQHGHTASHAKLSFPEPVAESRMPNPTMIGVGALLAIVLLVAWAIYSNRHSGSGETTASIPEAPVVSTTDSAVTEHPAISDMTAPVLETPADPSAVAVETTPVPAATSLIPPDAETLVKPVEPAAAAAAPAEQTAASPAVASTAAEAPPADALTPAPTEKEKAPAAPAAEKEKQPAKKETAKETADAKSKEKSSKKEADESTIINIKQGKSRVVVRANQASWVEITDSKKDVVYRKVLRPGEQFSVPDQPGLSLVTANAGGLDIEVDGQKVSTLGKSGEIVRGVTLDPAQLKKRKPKTEFNQ